MTDDAEITAIKARAIELARTGQYAGWSAIHDVLVAEGYLLTASAAISDDHDLHQSVDTLCDAHLRSFPK